MPVLRLFAAAREVAGVARADFDGTTVAEMLAAAEASYGERFTAVLSRSRVWVNGEPATAETPVAGQDVVAVLPPVSGGAGEGAVAVAPAPRPRTPTAPRPGTPTAPRPGTPTAPRPAPPAGHTGTPPPARPSRPNGPSDRRAAQDRRSGEPQDTRRAGVEDRHTAASPRPSDAKRHDPAQRPADARVGGGVGSVRPAGSRPPPRPDRPRPTRPEAPAPTPPRTAPRPAAGAGSSAPAPAREVATTPAGGATTAPVPRTPPGGRIGPGAPLRPPEGPSAPPRGPGPSAPPTRPPGPRARSPVRPEAASGRAPGVGPPEPEQWWSPLARLTVIHDNSRPHGRIGLAWAIVTIAATIAGPLWIAGWLGVSAFVGACQAAGTRRAMEIHPPPWVAGLVSLVPPVAAAFGTRYVVGALAALGILAVFVRTFVTHRAGAQDLSLALMIGLATGTAVAAMALTREVSTPAALYLLACACTYDAGAYLVGTGASAPWEGPLAGVVALIPVTILAAVVLVPPFPSGTPLALGLLAAVLAPLGPLLGTALLGRQEADAPGLRRLDSLMLLAPAWAWLVPTILD